MPVSQHTIAGTLITMPVKVRAANHHMAMFSVDADAAQRLVDYSGLQVCRYLPGRAIVSLMLVRYVDGDLGQYHEFGTAVMVNPPGSTAHGPRALSDAVAFIHHLPVDQTFTLEAGQRIWGFPKVMADFTVREARTFGFEVSIDGHLVAGMDFSPGLAVPSTFTRRPQVVKAYSHRDGVTRESKAEMTVTGLRGRPGGVRLRLGDHHYAKELATLGLPKRALASASVHNVAMSWDDARVVA